MHWYFEYDIGKLMKSNKILDNMNEIEKDKMIRISI